MSSTLGKYRELFEGFIVSTSPAANGDYICFCPAHEDPEESKSPSASINFTPENPSYYPYGMLHCHRCKFEGKDCSLDNIAKLYQDRIDRGVKIGKVNKAEKTHTWKVNGGDTAHAQKLPSPQQRKDYTAALLESTEILDKFIAKRGLTVETIQANGIGWIQSREAYCYPVFDMDGKVFGMRLYRPDSKTSKHSWYNSEGDHLPTLMAAGMEAEPVVILTEGEFDYYLAQQDGFKAVTHNAGAGKWHNEWNEFFRDKVLYIAYDNDAAGRKGRTKVVQALKNITKAIYFIDIPGEGNDYTDFRIAEGHSVSEFQSLLDAAQDKGPETETVSNGTLPATGKPVTIAESISSQYIGMPLEMTVQVLGRFDPPFVVPGKIHLECTQDKGEKYCSVCPMERGYMDLDIDKDSDFIQRVVGSREGDVKKLVLKESGAKCADKIVEIEYKESWAVEQIVVSESVESRREDQESHALTKSDTNLIMLSVDTSDSEVNEIYRVVGHQKPSPRDQRLTFTAWHREQTKTNIDQFEMDEGTKDMLEIFQPVGNETVYEKMYNIAADLTANVAGVVGREELAMAYDVSWHSALGFNFGGKLDSRGWVELLVFGDTRTGKSETAHRLAAWYRNGKVFSSEGATRAGLVGGATQPSGSKNWIATWGAIPQNDRRLIILDEAQALVDIVKDMGSIRSKGIAEMVKVGISQSTLARTRLIWICNPLTQGKLDEFPDGAMTALAEFMPASEDRARFDLAVALASSDVKDTQIYSGIQKDKVKPKYSSEACENLILWAWSRTPDDIEISKEVEDHILEVAAVVVEKYDRGNFELVQGSNMHVKLSRIAVACAARVFSTDETGEKLIVKEDHVNAAYEIIERAYDNTVLGLGRASKRAKNDSIRAEASLGQMETWLTTGKANGMMAYGIETYRAFKTATGGRFKMLDFGTLSGLDKDAAAQVMGDLVAMGVLSHDAVSRDVVLSRELIGLLRKMEDEDA